MAVIGSRPVRSARNLAFVLTMAMVSSGCLFFPNVARQQQFHPGDQPWWCGSATHGELAPADCRELSAQLDAALAAAHAAPHASDALAAGASATPYAEGVGAGFELTGPTATFNPAQPDTLLYDGVDPEAQIAGVEWNVGGSYAPEGFIGANDGWTSETPDVWTLRAWIVRPFEQQPEVFAAEHPCLGPTEAVYDTTADCYLDTHPEPLRILVTNDDGYDAAGIDAVVEALRVVPGVEVTVVAPATNQSGSGDNTTPGGVTSFAAQTISGYPAVAVNGFPADSVLHALRVLGVNPDLVVSGINFGQNIGPFVPVSGTVGAARTAARNGIPTLAASQGLGTPADWPSGTTWVLSWLNDFRLGRAGPPIDIVANLNVPTCTAGAIRGLRVLPVAPALNGRPFLTSDCTSTVTTLADDVDGFIYGFVTLSDVGLS
jgi:5'-nucleotidase